MGHPALNRRVKISFVPAERKVVLAHKRDSGQRKAFLGVGERTGRRKTKANLRRTVTSGQWWAVSYKPMSGTAEEKSKSQTPTPLGVGAEPVRFVTRTLCVIWSRPCLPGTAN